MLFIAVASGVALAGDLVVQPQDLRPVAQSVAATQGKVTAWTVGTDVGKTVRKALDGLDGVEIREAQPAALAAEVAAEETRCGLVVSAWDGLTVLAAVGTCPTTAGLPPVATPTIAAPAPGGPDPLAAYSTSRLYLGELWLNLPEGGTGGPIAHKAEWRRVVCTGDDRPLTVDALGALTGDPDAAMGAPGVSQAGGYAVVPTTYIGPIKHLGVTLPRAVFDEPEILVFIDRYDRALATALGLDAGKVAALDGRASSSEALPERWTGRCRALGPHP